MNRLYRQKDLWWTTLWLGVLMLLLIWDFFFLNTPALRRLLTATLNTLTISLLVSSFSLLLSWPMAYLLDRFERLSFSAPYMLLSFAMNLLRSIPQIIGVLGVYYWIVVSDISSVSSVLLLMSFGITLFIFPELVELMRERIAFFRQTDFFAAMSVNGIPERRIIHFDILWKNSRIHILNKLVSLFGAAIFLQCSVDFILSVGLSTEVSSVNLPVTLGSFLAKTDSKQDILSIGYALLHPSQLSGLLFEHLQGLSIAFIIVFSLFSIFKISNGFAERHRL